MDAMRHRARFDWLVEITGAAAPGLAAGFAALKLASSFGFSQAAGMVVSGLMASGIGLLAMWAVKPGVREHGLACFSIEPIDVDLLQGKVAAEPLLLEELYEGPLPIKDIAEGAELLLDEPLIADPASRVVQLFARPPISTPGQMKERIDRHLAAGSMRPERDDERSAPDASAALYAALAELRRSLR